MAKAAPILAVLAVSIVVIGIAGAYSGALAPLTGFMLFAGGALLGGLVCVVVSLVGVFLSRGGRDPLGQSKSLTGLAIGLGLIIVVLGAAATNPQVPPINDITTNLEDPPAFASADEVPDYAGRDMSYPTGFAALVREAYPDLAPLRLEGPLEQTFARALEAADSLGWQVVAKDPARGVFDAQQVSTIFRFVDDVTVRIVPDGDGCLVDVRSKSRDGRSDLGANAARIRAFLEELG